MANIKPNSLRLYAWRLMHTWWFMAHDSRRARFMAKGAPGLAWPGPRARFYRWESVCWGVEGIPSIENRNLIFNCLSSVNWKQNIFKLFKFLELKLQNFQFIFSWSCLIEFDPKFEFIKRGIRTFRHTHFPKQIKSSMYRMLIFSNISSEKDSRFSWALWSILVSPK